MQKLIKIITAAIAYLAGLKSSQAKLQEELKAATETISEQADTIEELRKQVEADKVDDDQLKAAADAAREAADDATAKLTELEAEIDAGNEEGAKLAELITDHPDTPNVDEDFNVVK